MSAVASLSALELRTYSKCHHTGETCIAFDNFNLFFPIMVTYFSLWIITTGGQTWREEKGEESKEGRDSRGEKHKPDFDTLKKIT